MRVCAIIPARLGSTRLRNKPLITLAGKAMILHVCEGASRSKLVNKVVVATDSVKIEECVKAAGFACVLTSKECKSGTDRVKEAMEQLSDFDIFVNVQGDEPLITGDVIDSAIQQFNQSDCDIGTVASRKITIEDYQSPDKVKLVMNSENKALYFSRAQIPFNRDGIKLPDNALIHIGIYVYKSGFLKEYVDLPYSALEECEKLEQLRALENGYSISVAVTDYESIGVDVPEDIKRVEKRINMEVE